MRAPGPRKRTAMSGHGFTQRVRCPALDAYVAFKEDMGFSGSLPGVVFETVRRLLCRTRLGPSSTVAPSKDG